MILKNVVLEILLKIYIIYILQIYFIKDLNLNIAQTIN